MAGKQKAAAKGAFRYDSNNNTNAINFYSKNNTNTKEKKSRMKSVRNAASSLQKKSEDVTVASVIKSLDDMRMKNDEVATRDKQPKKGMKITTKVVKKRLKSVRKSLKKESNKKDFSGDADVLTKKGKKY